MNAHVIGNIDELHLGNIASVIDDLGFLVSIHAREDGLSTRMMNDADLVLNLGSSWSLVSSEVQRASRDELEIIREVTRRGVPLIGICFGAQLLSHAFGGTVSTNSKPEIGWTRVESDNRVLGIDGEWMQWHYDGFSCPVGGEILATNPMGVQAIVVGRSLGVQFHPEANEDVVSAWVLSGGSRELEVLGVTVEQLMVETMSQSENSLGRCSGLVRSYLECFV
jgi:GMP synthase-like glutamine amidotransferase